MSDGREQLSRTALVALAGGAASLARSRPRGSASEDLRVSVRKQIRPRSVFCVIEKAHRDMALAEAVCAGRFTHAGVTLELELEPDWLAAGIDTDPEWRIEWRKFYYGLHLAFAFRETGNAKYLCAWERLVCSWIRQVPVGFDSSDIAGRRIQNWIYAWNGFASSPAFPGLHDGLDETIIGSLALQVQHLRQRLTAERNHRTLELYALFVAALAFTEIDGDGSLLKSAMEELHQNLLEDIRPDGVHREGSTHYHMIALRSFLGARENARRFELAFPASYDERLERACEFAMHCHRPDGEIPALSDADTGCYADLLELAASLLRRRDFLYAAAAGARGTPPKEKYVSFPDGGYFIQRSGWGDAVSPFRQERFLIIDCGPIGDGGHGHYDLLNIEIAAGARALVVDPGRFTYAEQPPNWRRWFKGTAAHNTVCIDGLDQTLYRCGKPKGPVGEGRLIKRVNAPNFDLIAGEARSPAYEVLHTRTIIFVADEYWIIVDRLRGDRPHRFDLRFHLSHEAIDETMVIEAGNNSAVCVPGLALVFGAGRRPSIEEGWIASRYGTKLRAPVVSVAEEGVCSADFFTLAVPLTQNVSTLSFRVCADGTDEFGVTVLEIDGAGPDCSATDLVAWSSRPEPVRLGEFQCRASAAWLRASQTAGSSVFQACDVQELTAVSGMKMEHLADAPSARWVAWGAQSGLIIRPDE